MGGPARRRSRRSCGGLGDRASRRRASLGRRRASLAYRFARRHPVRVARVRMQDIQARAAAATSIHAELAAMLLGYPRACLGPCAVTALRLRRTTSCIVHARKRAMGSWSTKHRRDGGCTHGMASMAGTRWPVSNLSSEIRQPGEPVSSRCEDTAGSQARAAIKAKAQPERHHPSSDLVPWGTVGWEGMGRPKLCRVPSHTRLSNNPHGVRRINTAGKITKDRRRTARA